MSCVGQLSYKTGHPASRGNRLHGNAPYPLPRDCVADYSDDNFIVLITSNTSLGSARLR